MNRRALVKQLMVMGLATALPLKKLSALNGNITSTGKRPFHRFMLGELELTVITDGHLIISPVQPAFAPRTDSAAVNTLLREHFRPTSSIDLSMNILLIRKGKQLILVDTGAGPLFGKNSGWLPQSLADAGFRPEQVTDIVLSHAHTDHIGGLLKTDGQLLFPSASIHLSAIEHHFWMADKQDFSKSEFRDKAALQNIIADTQRILTTVKNKLVLFEHPTELFGCLRLELAAGHTPGHTLVRIFSGREELVHIADMMHSDVLLFPHPEWGFFGDTDLEQAAATRKAILNRLATDKTRIFAYHLPWPGIGHTRINGNGYEWIAETYSYPG
ncbi:MBL fold metallo-hydrolase [Chitinophaga solisilvae]|uniref:MBL fold metallo-hydrolase n=1 Tax=Chitinophaga solisilvae TaxID=1233460 RepID=UPI00136DB409|nr:MBL fold metallo-hydrolase [Chitinophaga solisilvae]